MHEPILIKNCMNDNDMKYDIKGYSRSQKVIFLFENILFLKYMYITF